MLPPELVAALSDRYTLERELGQGGMATVYLAMDIRHQRRVAIKVLHPDIATVVGVERFLKEIQLTAALQHPHILPLFDSGAADGRVYYVMPFVDGETLRTRLDREQQLPVADALRITQEVASALAYAHQRGVVHRDIKPENILLQGGQALVADFGIALAATQVGGARLTQTGISLGTPQYMSPEQAMGERTIDARTDLFALGAVAYEMLTGEPPFSGPSVQAIVSKVLTSQPVPVDDLRRNVPEAAAAAIMCALEKLPADRPASAEQFVQMLLGGTAAPVGRTSGARKVAAARTPLQRAWPWIAGVAAGLALGVGVMSWRAPSASRTGTSARGEVRFLVSPPDSLEMMAVCCGRMFAISPDGRSIVFQARPHVTDGTRTPPAHRLYVREVGSLTPVPLPGTDSATSLAISPDGRELAFAVGTELSPRLRRIPLRGGEVTTITTLPPGFVGGISWRDAEHLVVADQYALLEVNARNGQTRTLLRADSTGQQITSPEVLPGGAILFNFATKQTLPTVHVLTKENSAPRLLFAGATPRYVAQWRALVVDRSGVLLAFPFNPATADTTGPGVRLAEDVPLRSPVVSHAEYDVTPGGSLALTNRQDGALQGWRASSDLTLRTGTRDEPVTPPEKGLVAFLVRFSPRAPKLLFSARGTASEGAVYVQDLERKTWTRTTGEEPASVADWTSNGDSIIYALSRSGRLRIRSADGSGSARELGTIAGWVGIDNMSVSGNWIAVSGSARAGSGLSSSLDIAVLRRDSTLRAVPYANSPADEDEPSISPDGHWLAYTSSASGRREVYVSPFPTPTSRITVSTEGGSQAFWTDGGKTLAYARPDGAFIGHTFTPGPQPTLGPPRQIHRRGVSRFWTITLDGSRIVTIDNSALLTLRGLEVVLDLAPRF